VAAVVLSQAPPSTLMTVAYQKITTREIPSEVTLDLAKSRIRESKEIPRRSLPPRAAVVGGLQIIS